MATFLNWPKFTDEAGRTWYVMQRESGTVTVYYTLPGVDAHFVVYDDLDALPKFEAAIKVRYGENDNDR